MWRKASDADFLVPPRLSKARGHLFTFLLVPNDGKYDVPIWPASTSWHQPSVWNIASSPTWLRVRNIEILQQGLLSVIALGKQNRLPALAKFDDTKPATQTTEGTARGKTIK